MEGAGGFSMWYQLLMVEHCEWCRQSRLLETWCLMEYAERGSLADALRRGRLRRADSGTPNLAAIVQCMQDIASGVLLPLCAWLMCHNCSPSDSR